MNNKVTISSMTVEDLLSIKDTLINDFDDFWSFSIFKSELENQNSYCLAAKKNEEIVGFIGIWHILDEFHITNIVTKKDCRNLGIASSLLQHAIDYSQNNNASFLTLEVNERNIAAINLYKKFNFETVGLRKNYYNGTDNAILMTRFFNK